MSATGTNQIDYTGDGCPACGAYPGTYHWSACPAADGSEMWAPASRKPPSRILGIFADATPTTPRTRKPSEREQWLARGLEQAISWITLDGHVPPAERTLRRVVRRWLLRWCITEEQRGWLGAVLHGNYPETRYPDHRGVQP